MNYSFDHVHLPPGQQSPVHTQGHFELAYIITGSGERILGDRCEPFRAGDLVLVPPGLRHQWKFSPEDTDGEGCIENLCLHFSRLFLSVLSELFPSLADCALRIQEFSQAILFVGKARERLIRSLTLMDRAEGTEAIAPLISILTQLAQGKDALPVSGSAHAGMPERQIEKLRVFIACNYARKITLNDAARCIGMNRTSLCRFFRRMTGQTFIDYLNAFRIAHAKDLLSSASYTVSEVAAACGYESPQHFTRTFRRLTGEPPTVFQRRMAGSLIPPDRQCG